MQPSVTAYRTAKDTGERLSFVDKLQPSSAVSTSYGEELTLELDPSVRRQTIRGFGGAFTESGGWALSKLPEAAQNDVIDRYFNPDTGLGYSLCRSHINSCDFSLGNYSACESPDDGLSGFNLRREEKWVLPFITRALSARGARFELLLTPWSPPAWMKTNGEMNNGGKLKPECREVWARFMAKFIRAYRDRGIPVSLVSIQNEPEAVQVWDSCIWSAEEEGEFVAKFLGPTLEREGLGDVGILIWDHNRDAMVRRAAGAIRFPGASRYIHGTAYHWYNGEQFENVSAVHELFPDKHLYFTEASIEKAPTSGGEWGSGERYAHHIINDMNNWCEGWMDWNMVLTSDGGPNHVGNYCDAPVLVDVDNSKVVYQSPFWYIGHFSRFVRPGYFHIDCNVCGNIPRAPAFPSPIWAAVSSSSAGGSIAPSDGPGIEAAAFSKTGKEAVAVVMNRTGDGKLLRISAFGAAVQAELVPRSITTFICENGG